MSKKKLIRTLTFVVGLYYVLEFFLPAEIGGDFDKQRVRNPSAVVDPANSTTFIYYVGEYDNRNQAVGLARETEPGVLTKSEGNPVLRSTLLNSYDRLGIYSLSVVKAGNQYYMFYLGEDLDRMKSVCWAVSPDGIKWQKQGRMNFITALPWRQYYEEERSAVRKTYGRVQCITGGVQNSRPFLLVAFTNIEKEAKTEVLIARPADGSRWQLEKEPLKLDTGLDFESISSMSIAGTDDEPELWIQTAEKQLLAMSMQYADGTITDVSAPVLKGEINDFRDVTVIRKDDRTRLWHTGGEGIIYAEINHNDAEGITVIQENVLETGKPSQTTYLSKGTKYAGDCLTIIGAFAIGLGVVNMCLVHGRNLARERKSIHNSIVFFILLIAMFIFTYSGKKFSDEIDAKQGVAFKDKTEYQHLEIRQEIEQDYSDYKLFLVQAYNFCFDVFIRNISTTVFALISFYMVGAAFRSFRIKSMEAFLLIISAIIVLLGQIPLGSALSWGYLPSISQKLLMIGNAAAYRGVILGMTIGALSMSLRLWLGLERGMFHGT